MQRFLAIRRLLTLALLLTASTIGLAGCGNKGPLFLPPEPVQEISSPAQEPEAKAESEDVNESEEPETTQAD